MADTDPEKDVAGSDFAQRQLAQMTAWREAELRGAAMEATLAAAIKPEPWWKRRARTLLRWLVTRRAGAHRSPLGLAFDTALILANLALFILALAVAHG